MYYQNYRRRLRREELTKKAREAKAPSRCDDANKCSNDGSASIEEGVCGKGSNIPQVMANMSMDSVDSTVDLSYASADTVDTNTSTDSAASTVNDEGEDVGKAASFDAKRQQRRRRLIAAASGGAHGTTTSTHTHVTTASAFQAWSADGRSNKIATVASACVARDEVHTHRQQQQQKCSGKRLICLISNGVADRVQAHRQLHALNILNVRQTPYEVVDGMDPAQRQRRDELFRISDIRGNYPQFFVERQIHNGYGGTRTKVEFWGSYERMEQLNEVDSLPPDVLLANPDIETWERVFGDCC